MVVKTLNKKKRCLLRGVIKKVIVVLVNWLKDLPPSFLTVELRPPTINRELNENCKLGMKTLSVKIGQQIATKYPFVVKLEPVFKKREHLSSEFQHTHFTKAFQYLATQF